MTTPLVRSLPFLDRYLTLRIFLTIAVGVGRVEVPVLPGLVTVALYSRRRYFAIVPARAD